MNSFEDDFPGPEEEWENNEYEDSLPVWDQVAHLPTGEPTQINKPPIRCSYWYKKASECPTAQHLLNSQLESIITMRAIFSDNDIVLFWGVENNDPDGEPDFLIEKRRR